MKKKKLIVASSIGIVLVVGAVVTALLLSSTPGTKANGNTASDANGSGTIVIAWNKELLKIVKTPGAQPATLHPTRSYAILHAAIYDAVVSITRDAPAYLFSVSAPGSARADAAAAEAGHDALVALYPKWKAALDQQLASELVAIPDGAGKQQGIRVGQTVAARLIAMRANDGSSATPAPFVPGNASQFRPGPPPAVTSQAYIQALNEVKSLGQNTSKTRTTDQTVIAKFWAGPIWNTWNEIAENAALAHHTNLETTARLFAVLNLSFADSTIAFYDAKYYYQIWRPVTAIRKTDPTWTPQAVTALDPSYPSAHGVISGDGAAVLSAFFGNQDQIQLTSDVLPGIVRTFVSYNDVSTEAGLSRIYAGQHTRIDIEVGSQLGQNVAQFVLQRIGG